MSRDELERQKLTDEISRLQQPWWKQPTYIAAVSLLLLSVTAIIVATGGGISDTRGYELSAIKDLVKLQKLTLEQRIAQLDEKDDELRRLKEEIARLQTTLNEERSAIEKERHVSEVKASIQHTGKNTPMWWRG